MFTYLKNKWRQYQHQRAETADLATIEKPRSGFVYNRQLVITDADSKGPYCNTVLVHYHKVLDLTVIHMTKLVAAEIGVKNPKPVEYVKISTHRGMISSIRRMPNTTCLVVTNFNRINNNHSAVLVDLDSEVYSNWKLFGRTYVNTPPYPDVRHISVRGTFNDYVVGELVPAQDSTQTNNADICDLFVMYTMFSLSTAQNIVVDRPLFNTIMTCDPEYAHDIVRYLIRVPRRGDLTTLDAYLQFKAMASLPNNTWKY